MSAPDLVSIIINNYNYGRFLGDCIDSALAQNFPNTEVIVVDDGSTDDSREVMVSYGDRVIAVTKENGGQASAFNAGFARSRGRVIIFLDSDDMLCPSAAETAFACFADPHVVKAHWRLVVVNEQGKSTNRLKPDRNTVLPDGDLRNAVLQHGPSNHVWPPTSGNAWARAFLEKLFPLDEDTYRLGADNHLFELAPLFGVIRTVHEPQSSFRMHGKNRWQKLDFDGKLDFALRFAEHYIPLLTRHCQDMGIPVDPAVWKRNSWWYRLQRAVGDLDLLIPNGTPFVLVDEALWGMEVSAKRHPIPFLEKGGQYWGHPPDDETATRELERLRQAGAAFLVIAWQAFWWLDYFSKFRDYLQTHFLCVLENDCLVIFDLSKGNESPPSKVQNQRVRADGSGQQKIY